MENKKRISKSSIYKWGIFKSNSQRHNRRKREGPMTAVYSESL